MWLVDGIFCSLECAKRYVLDHFPLGSNLLNLFGVMSRLVYGRPDHIIPAPSQRLLGKFSLSGGLSIEEFRKSTTRAVRSPVYPFKLKLPEFLTEEVEEETIDKTNLDTTMMDSDQEIALDVDSDDDVVESTKLTSSAIKPNCIEEGDEDEYNDEDELDE